MRKIVVVLTVVSALSLVGTARSQSYDPSRQAPMDLMVAPPDPVAYHEARERVRALLGQSKAAEAEPLAEQIAREYPRDGDNFILLAETKRALNKHLESARAFQRAGELLKWGTSEDLAFEAAAEYLHGGSKRLALDLLRHHITHSNSMGRTWLYDHKKLAALRSDPEFLEEFREIAGRPDTTGWSRDYGWRWDLQFLRNEVKRLNADYRNAPLPAEFERRYEELKDKVPELSDEEIFVGMNRMLAWFLFPSSAEPNARQELPGFLCSALAQRPEDDRCLPSADSAEWQGSGLPLAGLPETRRRTVRSRR